MSKTPVHSVTKPDPILVEQLFDVKGRYTTTIHEEGRYRDRVEGTAYDPEESQKIASDKWERRH